MLYIWLQACILGDVGVGIAIFAWPAGIRPGSTLMGRILPGPIRNRVEYGFFKKKPEAGPGRVRVL